MTVLSVELNPDNMNSKLDGVISQPISILPAVNAYLIITIIQIL